MCSSTLSVNCEKGGERHATVTRLPFPFFCSGHMPAICARPSKGKGEIYKRVENRRLSTLLCAARRQRKSPLRFSENLPPVRGEHAYAVRVPLGQSV